MNHLRRVMALAAPAALLAVAGCAQPEDEGVDIVGLGDDDSSPESSPTPTPTPTPTPEPSLDQAVYVAHDVVKDSEGTITQQGVLMGFDLATGASLGEPVSNLETPYGLQALEDGIVMVNLTNRNEVLVVDGWTMTELYRHPASSLGGIRPVDSLISPTLDGQAYWLTLNDGANTSVTNSALFIDLNPASEHYLQPVGEVGIGIGHHQAAFSSTRPRVVVSSFTDCSNVITVLDFSNPSDIAVVRTFSATDLGYDNSTLEKTCDTTESEGVSIKPHGCSSSLASGKVYCNATTPGRMLVVDVDAETPSLSTIELDGTGGGYVKAGEGGEYVYTIQANPREGNGGANCQIGQLVTIDAQTDAVASYTPLFYTGPDCTDVLTGTDEAASQPNHLKLSEDGSLLFVALAPSFGATGAYVRQQIVLDLSNPAEPVQLESIPVGPSSVQRGTAVSGDGRYHFVTNFDDASITQIDVDTLEVVATIPTTDKAKMVATYGTTEGPSLPVGPVH